MILNFLGHLFMAAFWSIVIVAVAIVIFGAR